MAGQTYGVHSSGISAPAFDWQDYGFGEHRITCPHCGRNQRDKTAGLKVDAAGAVLHCHRCHVVETFRDKHNAVRRAPRILPQYSQNAPKRTTLNEWGRRLWESTRELSGVAEAYLRHRRCVLPPKYGDLRWHPALKHRSGYVGPALVGLVRNIHSNEPMSLHRTWITATGKADIDPPRMTLGGHETKGGCIKLWPTEDVNHTLGIAEGVETALSMAHCIDATWSCIDAGHLGQFPVLAGISQLYISRDNDPAGIAAAAACADRWHRAGRYVEVSYQSQNDTNDLVKEGESA